MKIAVIGTGYVGLVTGTCLADLGNDTVCVDIDEAKVKKLREGISPIYEPGLDDLLRKNISKKRLSFTTDLAEAVKKSEVIFIAVGTPPAADGRADLSAVRTVAAGIGRNMNGHKIVINKSTVPVGSGDMVRDIIRENLAGKSDFDSTVPVGSGDMVRDIICENLAGKSDFDVVSNPEFLREGSAIEDFMHPDRVVIGSDNPAAAARISQIYDPLETEIVVTDVKSAEIIKYASNAFLAVKISFINEVANFCERADASVEAVSRGMGLDKRIGAAFLKAGIGYGGSCFPKDTQALYEKGRDLGYEFRLVRSAIDVNEEKKRLFLERIISLVAPGQGKKIAVWGLAFKPNTDDMREAPSIAIVEGLVKAGFRVAASDPVSMHEAKKIFGDSISYEDPYDALKDADALVILTDWNDFKQTDFDRVKSLLKTPLIIDGRNIYNPEEMKEKGFFYHSVGRKSL